VPLTDLIGVDGAAGVDDLHIPPASGWRVIAGDLNAADGHSAVIAAPSQQIDLR